LDELEVALQRACAKADGPVRQLPFELALAWFDGDDPAGALPAAALASWWNMLAQLRGNSELFGCPDTVAGAVELARVSESEALRGKCALHLFEGVGAWSETGFPCVELWHSLLDERHLARSDARRQVLRIFLKSLAIPDRVVDEHAAQLEAFEDGAWKSVDLRWPEPEHASTPGSGG
jgi:hypothetical protein